VGKAFSAERLLAEFLDNSTVGFGIVDDQLRYQALNLRLAEMNGKAIEFHLGKTLREVLGEVASEVEPAIRQVLATGQPIFNFEFSGTVSARAGPTRFIDHLLPLKDAKGRVKHVGAVVVEIRPSKHCEPEDVTRGAEWLPARDTLRSWKEIANYVGACIKTVQRWEKEHHFPIRRLERSKGAVVFALKSEVDSWIQTQTRQAS